MANIKSSKKDIRRTKRRTFINSGYRIDLDKLEKTFIKKPTDKNLSSIYSILDKMVKKNIIHKNKAARIKSKFISVLKEKS
ncbi:30S ribosomal protein S20 [Patescibacteria group bacterium]|nr:30S ribosomal protein S20 [Patescibacteria group bacterium]